MAPLYQVLKIFFDTKYDDILNNNYQIHTISKVLLQNEINTYIKYLKVNLEYLLLLLELFYANLYFQNNFQKIFLKHFTHITKDFHNFQLKEFF